MASAAAAAGEASTSEPAPKEKPIVVRVKRKPSQTRPDAFCEFHFYLAFSLIAPVLFLLEFLPNRRRGFDNLFAFSIRARD
jgi:hypothetical protein